MTVRQLIRRFLASEHGATAIEYAMIAAGVSILIVVAVNAIGVSMNTRYTDINTALTKQQ
jgi:pilus assembly protein Flp/PilA